MSISAKLSDIRTAISSAYGAVSAKGGSVPALPTLNALPSAIQTIPTGGGVSVTPLSVSDNGTYTASSGYAYSPVTVNVPTGGGGTDSRFRGLVEKTITSAEDSEVTTIASSAFQYCYSLTTASFPVCTSIGPYAFYYCSRLTTVSFPSCTTIASSAFYSCTALTTASFPVCTSIGSNAFNRCSRLTTASFPVCTSIYGYAFCSCSRLTTASFPVCTSIYGYAFQYCSRLSEIYIGTSNCVLSNSNAFSFTGIWSNKGSIYVPSDYVATYKTKTHWVYFSNRIFGY